MRQVGGGVHRPVGGVTVSRDVGELPLGTPAAIGQAESAGVILLIEFVKIPL